MKHDRLALKRVNFMPDSLEKGVVYYSENFKVAIHLCACGCGNKTVTPIDDHNGWRIDILDEEITLRPSIGNMQICGSHYFITNGRVNWL